MKNKNILEFCLSYGFGGLELFVKESFEYFKNKTDTFICVAPDTLLDKYIEDSNKITLKRNKLFPLLPALKLAKYIDEKDIDIIHFHWTKDIATVVLAKVLSKKKPKIVQSRHMRMTRFKDDIYHMWLYKNIDAMHAITKEVQKQLIKFIPQDANVDVNMVYLGVDEPKIDEIKVKDLKAKYGLNDSFVVGIVGRIEDGKGQHLVIDALSKLKDKNIKVLVVGKAMSEEYLDSLKQKVSGLGLDGRVLFSGFTKDVNEHMQLCDAVVLATAEETFGLVIIEAMANQKTIIAVDKGGPLEIIEDLKDGLLFKRDANELSKKIDILYEDKALSKDISQAGYQKVKKVFNKEIQMQKLYEMVAEV
jgi:glycosyltransferase involved in cell wall biosynthesis